MIIVSMGDAGTEVFQINKKGQASAVEHAVLDWDWFEDDPAEWWEQLHPQLRVWLSTRPDWEAVKEKLCDCADRSWFGVEHDSACILAGFPIKVQS